MAMSLTARCRGAPLLLMASGASAVATPLSASRRRWTILVNWAFIRFLPGTWSSTSGASARPWGREDRSAPWFGMGCMVVEGPRKIQRRRGSSLFTNRERFFRAVYVCSREW